MWVRILERQTGEGIDVWNRRIHEKHLSGEQSLRVWLTKRGVTGYARSLLVMEQFGYPDFLLAGAEELIDGQYADRRHLEPIFDAIVDAVKNLGEVIFQARKTYISLVTPRRTFARVQPATRNRVDLGLRLEGQKPCGRLKPSRINETMHLQVSLSRPNEVDSQVRRWLRQAYVGNC